MDNTIKNNIEEKKTKKSIIVGLCLIVLGSIIYIFLGLNIIFLLS